VLWYNEQETLEILTDVTWNSDNEPLAASITGQSRGICPYL
jgi:hypothetical protein